MLFSYYFLSQSFLCFSYLPSPLITVLLMKNFFEIFKSIIKVLLWSLLLFFLSVLCLTFKFSVIAKNQQFNQFSEFIKFRLINFLIDSLFITTTTKFNRISPLTARINRLQSVSNTSTQKREKICFLKMHEYEQLCIECSSENEIFSYAAVPI